MEKDARAEEEGERLLLPAEADGDQLGGDRSALRLDNAVSISLELP